MEQHKLEKQIREKLNSREIQPSAKAWDRLDAMLSVSEETKPKRNWNWLYIAAGIVGFLFVGLVFYNQENTSFDGTQNPIVTTNKMKESKTVEQEFPSAIKKQIEKNNQNLPEVVTVQNVEPKAKDQKTTTLPIQKSTSISTENKALVTNTKLESQIEKSSLPIESSTLVASVEPEKQISKTRNKAKLQIDPKILLSQVDGEIELTFRQKVIKSINRNYDSAKQSLASRNQE